MNKILNKTRNAILPIAVLLVCILAAAALIATSPKVERQTPPPPQPTVEILQTTPTSYQVEVASFGTVSPRTQSTLVSEIPGRIIEIAPHFRNGGFFEQNELLLTIDPRDYEIARIVARAELAQAQLQLREQQAQADQARKDWGRLGDGAKPTDLVLRKPQLTSNRAAVAAAQARLRQAEIDLERTHILAPYVGRVLEKNADVGQYVTQGSVLAKVYAVDYVEIRLPLTDRQQAVLDLPEIYRGETTAHKPGPEVALTAQVGSERHTWQGRIVRTEGAIDTQSRQLFAIAQVDDPYSRHDRRPPLKVGQFVQAKIKGVRFDNVFVLPREVLRNQDEVFVVNTEQRLERRRLKIVWRDAENVVANAGLAAGERLSMTPLPFSADGMQVHVKGTKLGTDEVQKKSPEHG